MRNTAIIFDGEEDHEIGLSYFFQHPLIESAKPSEVVQLYQSTAVFASVVRDMRDLIEHGTVSAVNDKKIGPEYLKQIEDGLYILEGMLMDLFGNESAIKIINDTNSKIDE
jgi:hypothetical protein